MDTVGLTAEYNPFHSGHEQQLALIRKEAGQASGIVVCLSGPFCQRGGPALLDKGVRAGLAIRMGADLVLELPQAFAFSSAERFAEGAVRTLLSTGIVRQLAYGTEDPLSHSLIRETAALLAQEPAELSARLRQGIADGLGFAKAREQALSDYSHNPEMARLLQNSNTILAVEYEKALARYGPLPTMALPLFDKENISASLIRDRIQEARDSREPDALWQLMQDLATLLPPASLALIMDALTRKSGLVTEEDLALSLLLSPAFSRRESLAAMEGMQGGLAGRLFNELKNDPAGALGQGSFPYEGLIRRLASRAHPASRIRRAILAAALGVEAENRFLTRESPGYIRVLAFSRRGQRLLSYMRKTATLPVITQASQFRRLDEKGRAQAALDLQAQALWNAHAGPPLESEFDRRVLRLR